ncbi:MAG: DUF423 domain-containing protein [Planctomycetaceae bacterium]|nr:DUF423 domain-containing protein [Planctomycetaceae bacterium]
MSGRTCLCLAGCLGFLAVFLGAFGAHGLKDTKYLTEKYAEFEPKVVAGYAIPASYKYAQDFETGVEYHMLHVLAMLATGLLMLQHPSRWLSVAAWCFLGGILFFSGALYVLVIGGPRWLGIPWGMVAPIGGTLQLLGWLAFAGGVWRMQGNGPAHQK